MADVKISALPAAATPLAGTEVLPIVQGASTVKVSNNDLRPKQIQSNVTSGVLQITGPAAASTRVMTTPDANFTVARTDATQSFTGDQTLATGNLVIGTSGKGIDFSATSGTGTSELLADYEEGTFTALMSFGGSSTGITYSANTGTYTKIGNVVNCYLRIILTNIGSSTGNLEISGLPYMVNANVFGYGSVVWVSGVNGAFPATGNVFVVFNSDKFLIGFNQGGAFTQLTNTYFGSISDFILGFTYLV